MKPRDSFALGLAVAVLMLSASALEGAYAGDRLVERIVEGDEGVEARVIANVGGNTLLGDAFDERSGLLYLGGGDVYDAQTGAQQGSWLAPLDPDDTDVERVIDNQAAQAAFRLTTYLVRRPHDDGGGDGVCALAGHVARHAGGAESAAARRLAVYAARAGN